MDVSDAHPPKDAQTDAGNQPSTALVTAPPDPQEMDTSINDDGNTCYDMTHERRGVAIIINNRDFEPATGMPKREGTDKDAASMNQMFKGLGFEAKILTNLTCLGMKTKLQEVAQLDHSNADCVAVALLTHGDEGDIVYGTDGLVKLTALISPFKSETCNKGLLKKPKLFFIQACRGDQLDDGLKCDSPTEDAASSNISYPPKLPREADFLIGYSTVEGHYAWRNTERGSVYVQTLYRMMAKYGKTLEIMQILTRVNNSVAEGFESNTADESMRGMKMMPCVLSKLRKELYFTPKQ